MYPSTEKYTIDFSKVEQYLEIHFVIKEALGFPDYYGCNWSAFWDCLTDMYGTPIHIEIHGFYVIERNFGDAAKKMVGIFRRFKHNYNDKYSNEIQIEFVSGNLRASLV